MFVSSVAPTQATNTDIYSAPISTSTPKVVSVMKVETELNKTTEDLVREEFSDIPIMVEIAKCESQFTQFNKDGSVHRGRINPADVGAFQVNESYHLRESQNLNLEYMFHNYMRATERGKSNVRAYQQFMILLHKREIDLLKMEQNIQL